MAVVKRKPFGGMGVKLDDALAVVLNGKPGQVIPPSEMNKRLWVYIKENSLKVTAK